MVSHPAYLARRSFGSLDGIRCLSILAVIWHHTDPPATRLASRGFLGVDMFFVLSGFLIVTLLLREQQRNGALSLGAFYARRALRIMPLYYGVLLACVLLFAVVRPGGAMAVGFWHDLPYLLSYTSNWAEIATFLSITWSLSAEEQFYLVWPPVQKYVRRPLIVLAGLLLVSQAIHFRLLDGPLAALGVGPRELPMLRETTFTPILLGVLLAHVLHSPRGYRRLAALLGSRYASLLLLLGLLYGLSVMPADISGWPRLAIHLLMTLLLASCVVREDHLLAGLLRAAPVARLGVLSYGMYLLHMFAVDLVVRAGAAGMPPHFDFVVCVVGSALLAELSYRFYETPFLRRKARFAR